MADSSLSPHLATAPLPPPSSRRLPPPCWSHDETVALIDAYRDKWYSLRRGNLRAPHWQEVADDVAARCPVSSGNPPKTSVQCRHKMEKLRKRYRAEIQRAVANPNPKGHRYGSSWVHFKSMDSMEKGPSSSIPVKPNQIDGDDDEDEEIYENQDYAEDLSPNPRSVKLKHGAPHSNGIGGGNGFRIRIPGSRSSMAHPGAKIYGQFDEISIPNPNYDYTKNLRDGYSGRFGLGQNGGERKGKKREGDPVAEMVWAIKVLGDGFVRMERMKMDMAREVEAMRMEMEIKRTEMILESQQRIVEAFAKGMSDRKNKKVKRAPTPES